ncbi:MAG: serine/threonine-protein kinase, partial [Planctomycetota bacterium]
NQEFKCPGCQKVFFRKPNANSPMNCQKCSALLPLPKFEITLDERIGNRIGGCIIARKLGQGGMGSVYLAFHTRLGKWVAIKILPKQEEKETQHFLGDYRDNYVAIKSLSQKEETNSYEQKRFLLEARAGSKLEHPNVIGVLDVGEENECYYMIQQYIEGESLRKRIVRQKRLTIREIIPILRGICAGLEYAHQNQIIHRDIKPDNIMLTPQNEVKIADFGLAKSLDKMSSLSVSGLILGTPHFMSPEQCEGKRSVDHRSDIYSLGATLFQMLTGEAPYVSRAEENSLMTILFRHVNDPIPNPLEFIPEIDPLFAQITMRCMAKKPEERFQSCQEILEYLDLYEKQQLDSEHFPTVSLSPGSIPKTPILRKYRRKLKIAGVTLLLLFMLGNFNKKNPQKKLENIDPNNPVEGMKAVPQDLLETHFKQYCESKNQDRIFEIWAQLKVQVPGWKMPELLKDSLKRAIAQDTLAYGKYVFRFVDNKKLEEARFLTELLWEVEPNWIRKTENKYQEKFKEFLHPEIPGISSKESNRLKITLANSQHLLKISMEPEGKGAIRRDLNDYPKMRNRVRSDIQEILERSYSSKTIFNVVDILVSQPYPDFSLIFTCVSMSTPPSDCFEVKDFRFYPNPDYDKILIVQECLKQVEVLLQRFQKLASQKKEIGQEIRIDNPTWNTQIDWYPTESKNLKYQMYLFMLPMKLLEEVISKEFQNEETLYQFCCFGILRKQFDWARISAKKLSASPRYQRIKKFLLEE